MKGIITLILFLLFSQLAFTQLPELIPYRVRNKWGYADSLGAIKIQPKYKMANPFSLGLACVQKGKKFGYIDLKGDLKIKLKYDWASSFNYEFDSKARVKIKHKSFYINLKGIEEKT